MRLPAPFRFAGLLAALLTLAVATPAATQSAPSTLPSPGEFFGFPMGAEKRLAGWDRIVEYFQLVDRMSDRVVVQELGKTTMGRPYIMAIVSSPDTVANLDGYRAMQRKLADPRTTTDEEAARIAREGKAVLLIGTNVHSTEIGNSQMVNDLIYRLATEQSPWVDHVLRNVILLLIPSENPDGQQMVVDWYTKHVGTPYEDAPLPDLYHKYVGHDSNRDNYMLTQVETQHLTRVTYKEWLPEVYLDKHQMGSGRARIFVPPYKNPSNPNVDPLVWSETNLLGQAMAARLNEAGKTGVIWGEQYTGFWQGANSTNPWWHNMVALLTETASSRLATTLQQERAEAGRIQPAEAPERGAGVERDPTLPLPAPTDTQARMNYTRPWLGGPWRLADVVEYQLLSALGLLEGVANNREMLKRNFYGMNKRTIEEFRHGAPSAYLVPARQRDPGAVARLIALIQAEAGEVYRAEAPFTADGREYPDGTWVLPLAQPFGRWIKDLLEPQQYPDIRWPFPTSPIDRPYDVTAWSLGMLMGVETVRVERPFEARLARVADGEAAPVGRVNGRGPAYVLDHAADASFTAMNRLLAEGAEVSWSRAPLTLNGRAFAPGAIVVRRAKAESVARAATELGLVVEAGTVAPAAEDVRITAPRVAVFEPWGGNMDAGWTRWLLEQHGFTYTHVRPPDVRKGGLRERFDVIVLAEMTSAQIVRGLRGNHVPPEYRGGIGEDGADALRTFVEQGGTVITLGNAAAFAVEYLGAPFQNTLASVGQDAFFCPGSILRVSLDTTQPLAYGMADEADAMFINNGAWEPSASFPTERVSTIARYPQAPLLRSGWIIGEARLRGMGAVFEASIGKGRIVLLTFRVQNRAQTWGTFKLFFNSLFAGSSTPAAGPAAAAAEAR